jgi:hypothetical protein
MSLSVVVLVCVTGAPSARSDPVVVLAVAVEVLNGTTPPSPGAGPPRRRSRARSQMSPFRPAPCPWFVFSVTVKPLDWATPASVAFTQFLSVALNENGKAVVAAFPV